MVDLETEGGERRPFSTILMTEKDAISEMLDYKRDGHSTARVVVDKDAALAYQRDHDAARAMMKRGASH